jgi:heme-NO-binding protein
VIGWIPRVLTGFLDEVGGPEARRAILAEAGLDPEAAGFRMDTDLPDPACRRIVEAACARLGVTEARAFALFAPHFLAAARATFPGFFRGAAGTRDFLLRQPAIHNSLAAGLRDPQRRAVADKFRVEATPRGVRVFYGSPNRLAALYVAIARELAGGFGEALDLRFEAGGPEDAACTILVEVRPASAADRPGAEPAAAEAA